MASQFASWIDFEPVPQTKNSPRSAQPLLIPAEPAPPAIELDQLNFGVRYNGPREAAAESLPPRTPAEIESSPPVRAEEATQSLAQPSRNKWRFSAACCMFAQFGLNDSATGALLPYLEAHYQIGYGTISLVF
jgi:hypothetical protein